MYVPQVLSAARGVGFATESPATLVTACQSVLQEDVPGGVADEEHEGKPPTSSRGATASRHVRHPNAFLARAGMAIFCRLPLVWWTGLTLGATSRAPGRQGMLPSLSRITRLLTATIACACGALAVAAGSALAAATEDPECGRNKLCLQARRHEPASDLREARGLHQVPRRRHESHYSDGHQGDADVQA